MRNPLYNLSIFKFGYAVAQLLPRPVTQRIAPALAWWSIRRVQGLRQMMSRNLNIVTGRTGVELDDLVAENARQFSLMLADYFLCSGNGCTRAGQLVTEWEGWEHLQASLNRGKGTILITGHLGHWELGGQILALRGLPMTVVTLPEPTDELTQWREAERRRLGIKTIAVGPGHDFAFVEMLRVLRNNGCLAMLVDRPYSGTGMEVKQFGHATQFSTAAAMLAHHTEASIIPAFVFRKPCTTYGAFAGEPIYQAKGDLRQTLAPNVQNIATLFETLIRKYPEQWFNYVPIFSNS
jgi:lauroyl/myristoyl acyltransferase